MAEATARENKLHAKTAVSVESTPVLHPVGNRFNFWADTSNRPVVVELAPVHIAPAICNEPGKDTMGDWLVAHRPVALLPTLAVLSVCCARTVLEDELVIAV